MLPATVEFVDIAGLVAGASKGEGLGNQFLANIRETDAIAHVVRCFDDENVVHVAGKVDPVSDIETIHTELALADLASVEKQIAKVEKVARAGGDKEAKRVYEVLAKVLAVLDAGRPARAADLYEEERALLAAVLPAHDEADDVRRQRRRERLPRQPLLDRLEAYAAAERAPVVPVCAKLEAEIADLEGDDRRAFLDDLGLAEPGLDRVIHARLQAARPADLLHRRAEGSARLDDPRRRHRARRRPGVIHTDFERGFIRAEVIAFTDYVAHHGEHGAKEAGKMRLEGKDYVVHDGDVVHFRFNV